MTPPTGALWLLLALSASINTVVDTVPVERSGAYAYLPRGSAHGLAKNNVVTIRGAACTIDTVSAHHARCILAHAVAPDVINVEIATSTTTPKTPSRHAREHTREAVRAAQATLRDAPRTLVAHAKTPRATSRNAQHVQARTQAVVADTSRAGHLRQSLLFDVGTAETFGDARVSVRTRASVAGDPISPVRDRFRPEPAELSLWAIDAGVDWRAASGRVGRTFLDGALGVTGLGIVDGLSGHIDISDGVRVRGAIGAVPNLVDLSQRFDDGAALIGVEARQHVAPFSHRLTVSEHVVVAAHSVGRLDVGGQVDVHAGAGAAVSASVTGSISDGDVSVPRASLLARFAPVDHLELYGDVRHMSASAIDIDAPTALTTSHALIGARVPTAVVKFDAFTGAAYVDGLGGRAVVGGAVAAPLFNVCDVEVGVREEIADDVMVTGISGGRVAHAQVSVDVFDVFVRVRPAYVESDMPGSALRELVLTTSIDASLASVGVPLWLSLRGHGIASLPPERGSFKRASSGGAVLDLTVGANF